MYLFIFEDGSFKKTDKIGDDDKLACEARLIDIVCMKTEKYYIDGVWADISKA